MNGQMNIFDFIGQQKNEQKYEIRELRQNKERYQKPICSFSNHSCNKEELWKIASEMVECKKVCCRNCDIGLCGARCNGSDEPLRPLWDSVEQCRYNVDYLCDRWRGGDEYIKKCKEDLIKGFQCTGCCHYCSQAPQNNGKCKFECRRMKQ